MSRSTLVATVAAATLLAAVAPASSASADDPVRPHRAVPDYDGRGEDQTTAGDVALWVPRVLLSPFYATSEYVVRRPGGWIVEHADPAGSANAPEAPSGPGLFPTFYGDVGMRPRIGLFFYWDALLGAGNALQLQVDTWGAESLGLTVMDRLELSDRRAWLSLRLSGEKRDDFLFAGLGPRSDNDDLARFQALRGEGRLALELLPSRRLRVTAWLGTRAVRYDDEGCCDEPTVMQRVGNLELEIPPGFERGFTAWNHGAEVVIDTRRVRPNPGSGIRIEVRGEHAIDLETSGESQWLRYGGSVSGILDLTGTRRELSLTLDTSFADPIAGGIVPFTEQASLGGSEPLPAFLPGRLLDRSAAAATLMYEWPIWVWLDAQIHIGAGNVFGAHLAGLDPELARLSFGLGVADRNPDGYLFKTILAVGTETIEDGATPSTVRFLFEVGHEI
jgi:hypothetical protein